MSRPEGHSGAMENALLDAADIAELREHLCRPLPELPSRYFWDDQGFGLYRKVTAQPGFYAERTEWRLLQAEVPDLLESLQPRHLVELGCGLGGRLQLVLDQLALRGLPVSCTLLDLNAGRLEQALRFFGDHYLGVRFKAVEGTVLDELYRLGPGGDRLILWLSGALGSVHPDRVTELLTLVAEILEPGDAFLVGVALEGPPEVMALPWNDGEGAAEAFNKHILTVVNARFGADFRPERYAHRAFYDKDFRWVELRLRSVEDHKVRIRAADLALKMARGQELRTSLSCRYTRRSLEDKAMGTGLVLEHWQADPRELFALALLKRA